MEIKQSKTKHDERKRCPIVESRLAGQAKADAILVVRMRDLHIGGKDRIGWGENGS